ncbi:MAG: hypothetical protein V4721_01865 [Bacteroidota bacterium]
MPEFSLVNIFSRLLPAEGHLLFPAAEKVSKKAAAASGAMGVSGWA